MRRLPAIAALSAFVLALSGCVGGGPSNGDVDKAQQALVTLGPEWSITWVTNTSSDSEGLDHYLSIGLHHDVPVETADLVQVFDSLAEALPTSYRWRLKISIVVGPNDDFPDLTSQVQLLGMDPGYASFYKDGDIWTTVKEMRRIVDEHKP